MAAQHIGAVKFSTTPAFTRSQALTAVTVNEFGVQEMAAADEIEQIGEDIRGIYADAEKLSARGFQSIDLGTDKDWLEQVNHVLPQGGGVYALVEDDPNNPGQKIIVMAEEDPSLLDPIMDCDLVFLPGETKPRYNPPGFQAEDPRQKFLGWQIDMQTGVYNAPPPEDIKDPIVEMQATIDDLTARLDALENN